MNYFKSDPPVTVDCIKNEIAMLLIKELNDYAINHPEYYPKELHPRIKQIGELLNDLGGFDLMSCASTVVPYKHDMNLNNLWDGIGSWAS